MTEKFVIWSGEHSAYWRANRCGYTHEIASAGRYTRAAAEDATGHCGPEKRIEIRPDPDFRCTDFFRNPIEAREDT